MDGVSTAVLAALAQKLGKKLFEVSREVSGAKKEIEEVGNNVLLLSSVFEELEETLEHHQQLCRPELRTSIDKISTRCAAILYDIERIAGIRDGKIPKATWKSRFTWYLMKDRVRLLQAALDSLKSSLSVLLHLVVLAKLSTQATVSDHDETPTAHDPRAERQRRVLTALVVDSSLKVHDLEQREFEEEPPLGRSLSASSRLSGRPVKHLFRSHKKHQSETMHVGASQSGPPWDHEPNIPQAGRGPGWDDPSDPGDDQDEPSGAHSLKHVFMYNPKTSHVLRDALPQIPVVSGPNSDAMSSVNDADVAVDLLLTDFTYVKIGAYVPPQDSRAEYQGVPQSVGEVPGPGAPGARHRGSDSITDLFDGDGLIEYGSNGMDNQNQSTNLHSMLGIDPYQIPQADERTRSPPGSERDKARTHRNEINPKSPSRAKRNVQFRRADGRKRSTSRASSSSTISIEEQLKKKFNLFDDDDQMAKVMFYVTAFSKIGKELRQRTAAPAVRLGRMEEKYLRCLHEQEIVQAERRVRREVLDRVRADDHQRFEAAAAAEAVKPLILKGFLGRSFEIPAEVCKSWQKVEGIISSAFAHNETVRKQIETNAYELVGANGNIIMPQVWDKVICPGSTIELRLLQNSMAAPTSASLDGLTANTPHSGLLSPRSPKRQDAESTSRSSRRSKLSIRSWLGHSKNEQSVVI